MGFQAPRKLRIGTRRSALAKAQTAWVGELIQKAGAPTETIEITSQGDLDATTPLYAIENSTPGLFTKHLEQALIRGEIDVAVHSLKDLPTRSEPNLAVAAIPERQDPRDVLVIHEAAWDPSAPLKVRAGSRIGTSSLRREALACQLDPSLSIFALRGNVPTRVAAVSKGTVQAAVLAQAGLTRLGLDASHPSMQGLILHPLSVESFVPAPGQGALAVQMRADDPAFSLVAALDTPHLRRMVHIEREILHGIHGGCTVPLGVHCSFVDGGVSISTRVYLGEFAQTRPMERTWLHHHRFDILGDDDESLVRQAVERLGQVRRH